jgi:hypothetical protein
MQDMYRKHGMYKNYEEYCYLVLEEELCFMVVVQTIRQHKLERAVLQLLIRYNDFPFI